MTGGAPGRLFNLKVLRGLTGAPLSLIYCSINEGRFTLKEKNND